MKPEAVAKNEVNDSIEYEPPTLECLGQLGEMIRGDGSNKEWDAALSCANVAGKWPNTNSCNNQLPGRG